MQKPLVFTVFFLLILLSACQKLYKADIPQLQWPKDKTYLIEFESPNDGASYDLQFFLRYNTAITHEEFKMKAKLTSPKGEVLEKELVFPRFREDGLPVGEELGGIGDILHTFSENYKFEEAGTYKFEAQQNMAPDILGGFLEVGIKLLEK